MKKQVNSQNNSKKKTAPNITNSTIKLESSKLSKSTNVKFPTKNKLNSTANKVDEKMNNLVSIIQNNKIVEKEHQDKVTSKSKFNNDANSSVKPSILSKIPKNDKPKVDNIKKASITLTNKPNKSKEKIMKQNSVEVTKRSSKTSNGKIENNVKSSSFNSKNSINNLLLGLKSVNPLESLNNKVFNILTKSDNRMIESSSVAKKMLLTNNTKNELLVPLDRKAIENKLLSSQVQVKTKIINTISESNTASKSVKEFAYREDRNNRNYMEDFSKVFDKFLNDPSKGLFTLYDGHGGTDVAVFSMEKMPEVFGKLLRENPINIEKNFGLAFQKIDEDLKSINSEDKGCTATIVYIYKENDMYQTGKRILYCANVGDSRCILISQEKEQGIVRRLSYDHKATDENEVDRIRKNGGVVFNNRIYGQLAVARSLGDHALKRYGVSNQPFISKSVLSDKDKYCIMASDGVWDVINDEEAMELALKCSTSYDVSSVLIKQAAIKGSNDNISCLTIKLN